MSVLLLLLLVRPKQISPSEMRSEKFAASTWHAAQRCTGYPVSHNDHDISVSAVLLQVKAMLDEAWYDQRKFAEGGWVTGLKYEDEIQDLLRVCETFSMDHRSCSISWVVDSSCAVCLKHQLHQTQRMRDLEKRGCPWQDTLIKVSLFPVIRRGRSELSS